LGLFIIALFVSAVGGLGNSEDIPVPQKACHQSITPKT